MHPTSRILQVLTIGQLLCEQAEQNPHSIAIAAPNRLSLTYSRLYTHIQDTVKTLNSMGLGRGERIAIVLPNGPEMAVAFLAVSACATSVPLNPAYLAPEFEFYLDDLNAKALIVQSGVDSPARAVAKARHMPIIELEPLEAEAGIFQLVGDSKLPAVSNAFAQPEDVALVLHTSGTTSRPKIVPLTQANLCNAANNIRTALQLRQSDRCLNVMPLFHVQGLITAILSSLSAGASVACTSGFDASKFFVWLQAMQPTWYTAVPTIHQAVLAAAADKHTSFAHCSPLRFIRSGGAALPVKVMKALEELFSAPVLEGYGMTETGSITSINPLPPRQRKPGSVGIAAGVEIGIMNEAGHLLSPGEIGEIVVRGGNVMSEYENNPAANQNTIYNGWFRTGDEGYFDSDRYLFITGRLKEIINRGGEKISPREVDEVLLDYPEVTQALTFALPHPTLGEDVGAAIVLQEKATITQREIREFAATRLADFKVPAQVVFVDEIPKSATGKLQRVGLAEKLATKLRVAFVEPSTEVEKVLAEIWTEVLGVERVGLYDNFFALGGDSLKAVQLFAQIEKTFGKNLPLATLFQAATIKELADIIRQEEWLAPWSSLVAIQPNGSKPPLFCIAPLGCSGLMYRDLAMSLGDDQPVYGLQAIGLDGNFILSRIEDMADQYIAQIRTIQPNGPYFLAGWSAGGLVCWELAQRFVAQGQKVALLALFDSFGPEYPKLLPPIPRLLSVLHWAMFNYLPRVRHLPKKIVTQLKPQRIKQILLMILARLAFVKQVLNKEQKIDKLNEQGGLQYRINTYHSSSHVSYLEKWLNFLILFIFHNSPTGYYFAGGLYLNALSKLSQEQQKFERANSKDAKAYVPQVYPGRAILFRASQPLPGVYRDLQLGWDGMATGGLEIYEVPGNHLSIMASPVLAEKLKACIDEVVRQKSLVNLR
jgi:acyl-CoA synthetase (AMP-forming)/AMP-acid ligase II/thioesterase domain-containing protein/acyl carrier protein